jgi:hypothetical protein
MRTIITSRREGPHQGSGMRSRPHLRLLLLLVLACTALSAAGSDAAVMTFDGVPLGTVYGDPVSQTPGDIVLTEGGIVMSVEYFQTGGASSFQSAIIDPASPPLAPFPGFGQINVLEMATIAAKFDFTGLPDAPPVTVSFDYWDTWSGTENLKVNNGPLHEPLAFSDLDGMIVAPGVTCTVTWSTGTYGEVGTVTLAGRIESLLVGSQEMQIDDVRAECLPGGEGNGCLDCDYEVTHEPLGVGMAWGGPHGDAPGDVAFTEDGIPVVLRQFRDGAGGLGFNECVIEWSASGFGVEKFMHFREIDVSYEINALGEPVEVVFFYFADLGGVDNMRVNGAPMFIGDLELAPTDIAPGIEFFALDVMPIIGGGVTGIGMLVGDVQRLVLGGENFYADEICVYTDEDANLCDLLVDFESQTVGTTWGALYGQSPGDIIFVESDIPVGLAEFTDAGGGKSFTKAIIQTDWSGCLQDNVMDLSEIAVTYNIAASGVRASAVLFDYIGTGGDHNLQVNGATLYVGDLASAPVDIAPGVICEVVTTPLGGGSDVCGTVVLLGDVQQLLVGGEVLWMDNVCVIAATGAGPLICDHEVRFEDEPLGTAYGAGAGDLPGDVILTEDGIPVSLAEFFDGTSLVFWNGTIETAASSTGVTDGQALGLYALSTVYDFSGLGQPVEAVSFEFVDWAGIENLGVNGGSFFYGQISSMPFDIAAGVTCEIVSWPILSGEAAGIVTLTGNVQSLRLGGQQFQVDNVCVHLKQTTSVANPLRHQIQLMDSPYPNPCNPRTSLSFTLPAPGPVKLAMYDLSGRRVAVLADGHFEAGRHSVIWSGKDDAGRPQPSGIYFARIEAAGLVDSRKVILLK